MCRNPLKSNLFQQTLFRVLRALRDSDNTRGQIPTARAYSYAIRNLYANFKTDILPISAQKCAAAAAAAQYRACLLYRKLLVCGLWHKLESLCYIFWCHPRFRQHAQADGTKSTV